MDFSKMDYWVDHLIKRIALGHESITISKSDITLDNAVQVALKTERRLLVLKDAYEFEAK